MQSLLVFWLGMSVVDMDFGGIDVGMFCSNIMIPDITKCAIDIAPKNSAEQPTNEGFLVDCLFAGTIICQMKLEMAPSFVEVLASFFDYLLQNPVLMIEMSGPAVS